MTWEKSKALHLQDFQTQDFSEKVESARWQVTGKHSQGRWKRNLSVSAGLHSPPVSHSSSLYLETRFGGEAREAFVFWELNQPRRSVS